MIPNYFSIQLESEQINKRGQGKHYNLLFNSHMLKVALSCSDSVRLSGGKKKDHYFPPTSMYEKIILHHFEDVYLVFLNSGCTFESSESLKIFPVSGLHPRPIKLEFLRVRLMHKCCLKLPW